MRPSLSAWQLLVQLSGDNGLSVMHGGEIEVTMVVMEYQGQWQTGCKISSNDLLAGNGEGGLSERQGEGGIGARTARSGTV